MEETKFKYIEYQNRRFKRAYGKLFAETDPDWRIELECAFNHKLTKAQGGLDPKNHLWEAIKILYPAYYAPDNYFMDHFFESALGAENIYAIIGPGGFGKTTMEALFGILAWVCMPANTICMFGTTTKESGDVRIWGNVVDLFNENIEIFQEFASVKADKISYRQRIAGTNKWKVNKLHCMKAVALPEGQGNVKKLLKGTHPNTNKRFKKGRLFIFLDEYNSSAPAHSVFPNLMQGGVEFKAFLTGNPIDKFDALGLACEPVDGWDSFKVMEVENLKEAIYKTSIGGICVVFPGFLNPRIYYMKKEGDRYDGRFDYFSTLEYIEEQKEALGEEDWMEQIIGFYPARNIGETLYILERHDIISTNSNKPIVWPGIGEVIRLAACDPAPTAGGDETILRVAEFGRFGSGKQGLNFLENHIYSINIPNVTDRSRYDILAEEIVKKLTYLRVEPRHFAMDNNTYGNAIGEAIYHGWSHDIHLINPQGSPSSMPIYPDKPDTSKDIVDNRVAELWYMFRLFVLSGQIKGLDAQTMQEMFTRSWKRTGKKISVETKTEYKKKMTGPGRKGRSPDRADCATYILDLARKHGLYLDNKNTGAQVIIQEHIDTGEFKAIAQQMHNEQLMDSLESHLEIEAYDLSDDYYDY